MVDSTKQTLDSLHGTIERVVFHSVDSGFCVLRTKVKGHRDLVTVVGSAANVTAGEYFECQGQWINDRQHGLQFKAQQLKTVLPTTLHGMEKYLGSGMVKGIGPHFAKKLITAFGDNVFDVIEQKSHRLTELPGIGHKRQQQITAAWAEQKTVRDIMVFLQSYGVGTNRAVRIYKTYGAKAIEKVTENPYRLATDIWGIGFKTADNLAMQLGIASDSLIRAQAGVCHVLQNLCDSGHCAAPLSTLVETSCDLLEMPVSTVEQAITHELEQERLFQDEINNQPCVYPASLYQAEVNAAKQVRRLINKNPPWGKIAVDKAISWVEDKTDLTLADSQRVAITTVLQSKVSIITGGPGVGKTTIVNSLIKILGAKKLEILLCAPTGRAAKRLTETTGLTAKTIHRLLQFDPASHGFKHDRDNPLSTDVLIIDESSMLDIALFNSLLKAVPDKAAVVFVGDIDQLPSVGSGAVLSDLIQSGQITTVRLTEIFRQAADSNIIINAHRINHGQLPLAHHAKTSDFFTLYTETTESVQQQLIQIVTKRLPAHYQYNPITDIQVLTPMNRGSLGSRSLNVALQESLNSHCVPSINRFGSSYAPGDKVIQMTNNYDKDVFNGDIGFIQQIDLELGVVYIRFDEDIKEYSLHELDEINLAYAISIHKSQGSEFPVIVMPLAMQHYTLLARNLLYTGVTRGKKLVVLIGQKKAVAMAIHNNNAARRLTKLAERLQTLGSF